MSHLVRASGSQLYQALAKELLVCVFISIPLIACTYRTQQEEHSGLTKLKAVAAACRDCREMRGEWPPPAIFDSDGKPLHSWRVLVVPYLEKNWFADAYRMDEPWDGPSNQRLFRECFEGQGKSRRDVTGVRKWFACRDDATGSVKTTTCFFMIVDSNEPSAPLTYQPRLAKLPRCQQNRLAGGAPIIVELSKSTIHWMEPRDLTLGEVSLLLDGSERADLPQVMGVAVLSPDSNVQILHGTAATHRLQDMVRAANTNTSQEAAKTRR